MSNVSYAQRQIALDRANASRIGRAQTLRDLRAHQLDPVDLVLNPPACLAGMFTFDFLQEIPGLGRYGIRAINRRAIFDGVNLAVTLGELTPLRRQWLAAVLRARRRYDPIASRPQG